MSWHSRSVEYNDIPLVEQTPESKDLKIPAGFDRILLAQEDVLRGIFKQQIEPSTPGKDERMSH